MNVYLTLFYSSERKMQTMDQNICLTVQSILKDILFELKVNRDYNEDQVEGLRGFKLFELCTFHVFYELSALGYCVSN